MSLPKAPTPRRPSPRHPRRGAAGTASDSGDPAAARNERLKLALLATASTVITAGVCAGALAWYRRRIDPVAAGKVTNQVAWERTYTERRVPVPASGPRDGYWGSRLGPKVPDARFGWHEGRASVPGLLEIDERGVQRYTSAASSKRHVLIIGGSLALGGYASSIETTYSHVLGVELERRGTPADLTIVAGGAWKSIQELRALETYGPALEPDLVVFLDGLNDLTSGATSRTLFGQPTPTADGLPWTSEYHAHDYQQRVMDYLVIVGRAAALTAAMGRELLVVLQPSLVERAHRTPVEDVLLAGSLRPHASAAALIQSYEAMRRGLAEQARAGKLHFLDCSRLFDGERATTFADMWHFSDFGHAILGRAMAGEIASLLARRPTPAR